MHLVGVKSMTLEQLKSYHSTKTDSLCPGHPEIENEGVEVTTGPLGQGVANAVGLAMATKNLAATYNKPGFELVNNMTWCMIGDACLQEGVGLEAVSLAGHWRLNNLCIIYDNNSITCDGTADVANTEDINAKMEATGWNVLNVFDGDSDVAGMFASVPLEYAPTHDIQASSKPSSRPDQVISRPLSTFAQLSASDLPQRVTQKHMEQLSASTTWPTLRSRSAWTPMSISTFHKTSMTFSQIFVSAAMPTRPSGSRPFRDTRKRIPCLGQNSAFVSLGRCPMIGRSASLAGQSFQLSPRHRESLQVL